MCCVIYLNRLYLFTALKTFLISLKFPKDPHACGPLGDMDPCLKSCDVLQKEF